MICNMLMMNSWGKYLNWRFEECIEDEKFRKCSEKVIKGYCSSISMKVCLFLF